MPASPSERADAKKIALDIRCRVCEEILMALLQRSKTGSGPYQLDEDWIMEQLFNKPEEDLPLLYTYDAGALNDQERFVSAHRKGCNKHFKEELVQKGWQVVMCKGQPRHCLEKSEHVPSRSDAETFSMEKDAIFYACQDTLGEHGEEIASNLAELQQVVGDMSKQQVQKAIAAQCRKTAKCIDRNEVTGKKKAKAQTKSVENRGRAEEL
eukprot:gnl/MRDRNA2_/MRDRNA2_70672_c0_seq1.p1 gnl/MRDRNA2_/MRDRNA2_70672_c0~~gnl/MRDRNA2_/MRDRNA2_70672_c0_seq1.p1  ORF type:complete len:210 (+),score=55.11 gnl/MRDRNA2_/MRDRNA2_70672_c0_seq1:142-771(+)